MAYATTTEVQAKIPEFVIGASTKPSTSEVTNFISQIDGRINGVLSAQGYETIPATGSNDLAMLEGLVSHKVAAMVLLIAYPGDTVPDKVKLWTEQFDTFLRDLRKGDTFLIDQQPMGDQAPLFAVIRHPTRDDTFTERYDESDWDEDGL